MKRGAATTGARRKRRPTGEWNDWSGGVSMRSVGGGLGYGGCLRSGRITGVNLNNVRVGVGRSIAVAAVVVVQVRLDLVRLDLVLYMPSTEACRKVSFDLLSA